MVEKAQDNIDIQMIKETIDSLEDKYSKTQVKLMFSKKATKIDEIFTVALTLCSKCQIDGEDFVNFRGFLRKS